MLEKLIIRHCSPTLAGIKTANLFNYKYTCSTILQNEIDNINYLLNSKGVYVVCLKKSPERALLYVYRPKRLKADLTDIDVAKFLIQYGYQCDDIISCINNLSYRISKLSCFPHEIGIFLGYPLFDVISFIENEGKNSKCVGCWKVYSNENEAKQLFAKYKKCTDVYCKKIAEGLSILRLTVVA